MELLKETLIHPKWYVIELLKDTLIHSKRIRHGTVKGDIHPKRIRHGTVKGHLHSERICQGKFVRGQIQSVLWILEGGYVEFLTNFSIFGTPTPSFHTNLFKCLFQGSTYILNWQTFYGELWVIVDSTIDWILHPDDETLHSLSVNLAAPPHFVYKMYTIFMYIMYGTPCTFRWNTWWVSWRDLSRFEVGFKCRVSP